MIYLIAGPTTSGKSAFALDIAARTGGMIVNADSMQVYRDWHILTARPSANDEKQAPHIFYGHVDANINYSVGHYLRDVEPLVEGARQKGQDLIFTGGTGLYFKALCEGLSAVPPVPDDVREQLRQETQAYSSEELHQRLQAIDPIMAARLKPQDRLRILRALEVFAATGQSLSFFQNNKQVPLLHGCELKKIFLLPERSVLNERINQRFDVMLKSGVLEEAKAMLQRQLDPFLPAMRAHGAPDLMAYLRGEISLESAAEKAKMDTRHYAKRQITWFRNQMKEWEVIEM